MEKSKTYYWTGTDIHKKTLSGQISGENSHLVKAILRSQGINPKKLSRTNLLNNLRKKQKISHKDRIHYYQQISQLLSSGIPLQKCMTLLASTEKNHLIKRISQEISEKITQGNSLTQACEPYKDLFPTYIQSMIQIGETTGLLDKVLEKTAEEQEKQYHLKMKMQKSLLYPCAIILIAFMVLLILLVFIVPQFKTLFEQFNAPLPIATQVLISISSGFSTYFPIIFIAIVLAIFVLKTRYHRSKKIQKKLQKILRKIPIIGAIWEKIWIARCLQTLSTSLQAGIPITQSLELTEQTIAHIGYRDDLKTMSEKIQEGFTFEQCLENTQFPDLMKQMLIIGEHSGNLEIMLSQLQMHLNKQIDHSLETLTTLIEPFMMIMLGIILGSMIFALYLPIFNLGTII